MNITRDPLSRATEIFDPVGNKTQVTYDIADNVTQVKDALNGATGVAYQAGRENRLPTTVTDAKNHATGVAYDVQGRVTSVTNALNQSASISYDAMSRPSQVTTRNGQTIGFAYDTLNRLTQLSLPEGNMNLGYDAAGRLLTASHYNGSSLALTYNPVNWVTQVVQTLPNGFSATLGYSYDANGNRTGMTTPWGNFSYSYDAMDRVTSIRNAFSQTIAFIYDALGRRTKMTYPNGTEADYAYDAVGQISQVLHQKTADQTAIAFTNYAYDAAGNRTGMTDMTGAHAYGYDALNRLTSASHPGMSSLPVKAETFDYDAIGNRTADALRTGYAYDAANRIVSDSSFTYTSNADGNILTRTSRATGETLTFVYNSGNRLIEVDGPTVALATYKYNMAGNRIEKNVNGVVTRFIYDGKNILAILDADNNLIALFTHGPGIDSPLIMHKGGADYFYHADALGNVTALTDSAGATVETYEYEAFGKTVVKDAQGGLHDQSTVGNPFMYTSREYDMESGLYYLRTRYLDPEAGRFMQEDPIASINQYTYVNNNPILFIDPLGLCDTKPSSKSGRFIIVASQEDIDRFLAHDNMEHYGFEFGPATYIHQSRTSATPAEIALFIAEYIGKHGGLNVNFNAGNGLLGVNGKVSFDGKGISVRAGGGWGVGTGVSGGPNWGVGNNSGWGLTGSVSGGALIGGGASGTYSQGGLSAAGYTGWGYGAGGSVTIGYTQRVHSW